MGIARHFNGTEHSGGFPALVDDFLSSPSSSDSYNGFSFFAWLKRDWTNTRNAIAGRMFSATNGWAVFMDENENLCFQHNDQVGSSSVGDLAEWTFVAVTYDPSLGSDQKKFYAGSTAADIVLVGTDSGSGSFNELSTLPVLIGWIWQGDLLDLDGWNGSIDQLGIYYTALTLTQLKEAALCGSLVDVDNMKWVLPITGNDPEPAYHHGVPSDDFVVFGTTVLSGVPVGCDFAGTLPVDDSSGFEDEGEIRVTQARKWYAWRIGPAIPEASCTFVPVVRILRASDFLPVMELDLYSTLRYTRRWTDLDDFELKFSCDTDQGLRLAQILKPSDGSKQNGKYLVASILNQVIDFVGFIDRIMGFKGGGRHEMTISGYGLDRILSDRVLAPATGDEFDVYDDPVETIIKTMLDRHIKTPGTFTTLIPGFNEAQREVSQLLIGVDKELGPTIVYNGRFQRLIEGVRDVIQAAEGTLGYTLQLVSGMILFDVVPGNDRSLSVVFSPDYDNVSEFSWEHDGLNFASHAVMGGQGTGAAKLLQTVLTAESERFFIERREAYTDVSDADTAAKLQDKGKAFLQDKGKVEIVRLKKLPGSRPCYKEDWDVGDFVGLRDQQYGINQSSRVEEVTVSCAGGRVTEFDLVLAKASPIGPLMQLSGWRQGATNAVARQ